MEMPPAVTAAAATSQDGAVPGAAAKVAEAPLPPQKSPLDKPLGELTEDDIAQVTREDCRRFLKDKGMRRPSWNKSQAIQQVISLKALLEGKPPAGGGGGVRPPAARQEPPDPAPPPQPVVSLPPPPLPPPTTPQAHPLPSQQQQLPAPSYRHPSNSEETPYRRRDPAAPPPFLPCGAPFTRPPSPPATEPHPPEVAGISPRVAAEAPPQPQAASRQMTIFYGGRVNVYNEVPTEKQARAIMQFAASRESYGGPMSPPVDLNRPAVIAQHHCSAPLSVSLHPPALLPPAASSVGCIKFLPHYSREGAEWRSPKDFEPEGPICRKASLQRYLEKRKDRKTVKYKKTTEGSPTSFMEMYLSQKLTCQRSIGRQGNDPSSPGHPNPPPTPTRSCSIDNQTKSVRFYIDLNDDDVQEV